MTKEELINLQVLFKNKSDLDNIRLGITIILNEEFYYSQIREYAYELLNKWEEWVYELKDIHCRLFTAKFLSSVANIYKLLGYEQNRIK